MNNAIAANPMALELLSDLFLKILQFMSSKTTNQSDITIGVTSELESGLKWWAKCCTVYFRALAPLVRYLCQLEAEK